MENKNCKFLIVALWFAILFSSCEEDGLHEPIEQSKAKPGTVSNVEVTPLPGGAKVSYILPKDKNLSYVRGVYHLSNGKEVEVKSSQYNNFLIVEGLGNTNETSITLYAVTASQVSSDPVEVSFEPLEPSFYETFRSVEMINTYGGMRLRARNEAEEDLAYLILLKDSITREWSPLENSLYGSAQEVNYSVRGYSSDSTYTFGLVLRDRYENYTDTIFSEITPLFEELIPTGGYYFQKLTGDARIHEQTTNAKALWDGAIAGWPGTVLLTQAEYTPFEPHMITINLGKLVQLSRLKIWDYPEWDGPQNVYFARGAMRRFEVYGSVAFNPNGELDSTWFKLGDFESIKPSGLPEWMVTNEDIEAGQRGLDYEFDENIPQVQFIRIRCLENWEGGTFIALAELLAYGDDLDDSNNY